MPRATLTGTQFMSRKVYRQESKPVWRVSAVTRSGRTFELSVPRQAADRPASFALDVEDNPADPIEKFMLFAGPRPPSGVRETITREQAFGRTMYSVLPPNVPENVLDLPDDVLEELTRPDPPSTPTAPPTPSPALPAAVVALDASASGEPIQIVGTSQSSGPGQATIHWYRDLSFEAELNRRGVSWRLVCDYRLAGVDLEASRQNSARPSLQGGLDVRRVGGIQVKLKTSDDVYWKPLFIVSRPPWVRLPVTDQQDLVFGGNHRTNSAIPLGYWTACAYVVDGAGITPSTARQLAISHTNQEGEGLSFEDRLDSALRDWTEDPNADLEEIARQNMIELRELRKHVRFKIFRRRLSADGDLHVPRSDRLTTSLVESLIRLEPYPDGFRALATAVTEQTRTPTSKEVREAVNLILGAPSDEERRRRLQEAVDRFRSRRTRGQAAARGTSDRSKKAVIVRAADTLVGYIDTKIASNLDVRDAITNQNDRQEIRNALVRVRDKAEETIRRLDQ